MGYRTCKFPDHEEGHEKIALYTDKNDEVTHASRQLESGEWTSKLGYEALIEHPFRGLDGGVYGSIDLVMRRKIVEPPALITDMAKLLS